MTASNELAIVMSGGGARAAYQVGFLRYIAEIYPKLSFDILTGVSAGAINASFLAADASNFARRIEELTTLWNTVQVDHVFRVDTWSLVGQINRWVLRLASGGLLGRSAAKSLVDTRPLGEFLCDGLKAPSKVIPGISQSIQQGHLKAIAITATSYNTGQAVTWLQGRAIEGWERPNRKSIFSELTVDHIMASAALPLFFPAVQIGREWYGDGGIRLAAPLSPALHLGASRILAISTRYDRSRAEADQSVVYGYPPPAQVSGLLMNAIFLDLFDQDAARLQRINKLVEAVPVDQRKGFKVVKLLVARPSQDLARVANDYELKLPRLFRYLMHSLGTRQLRSNDILSMLMFQRDYVSRLIEMGETDARQRHDEIAAFLTEDSSRKVPSSFPQRVG